MPTRLPNGQSPLKKTAPSRILPAALLGMMAALMFVAVAAQYAYAPATVSSVDDSSERFDPDVSILLPPGTSSGKDSIVYIDDPLSPAFAIGYSENGRASIGLIVWDRSERRYSLSSSVSLSVKGLAFAAAPRVRIAPLAPAGQSVIIAEGSLGGETTAAAVVVRLGSDKVILAERREEDGSVLPALFASGTKTAPSETMEFQDLDGDGHGDLLVTSEIDGRKLSRAYAWNGKRFDYDAELSWVLSMRARLFPEPK